MHLKGRAPSAIIIVVLALISIAVHILIRTSTIVFVVVIVVLRPMKRDAPSLLRSSRLETGQGLGRDTSPIRVYGCRVQ